LRLRLSRPSNITAPTAATAPTTLLATPATVLTAPRTALIMFLNILFLPFVILNARLRTIRRT
jgi:hypothetical protein